MEIAFSRLDDTVGRFCLQTSSTAFANAIRRAMIGQVPTLAIDEIRIYDNTSALFDEMLAHRLGLIPLRTESSCYVRREKCTCNGEGCPACTVTYTLSVEGPGTIYSRDLIPADPTAEPADPNIPIVKLTKDQKVVLEAKAVFSAGEEHAKWQPTSACGYKNFPVIDVRDNCDACGRCVDECPRGILTLEHKKVVPIPERIEECSLCRLCERACIGTGIGDEPAIKVKADNSRFIFVVEGDGSLPVKTIIEQALVYIKEQSADLMECIGEISGVTIDEEKEE
ncbi:MAG TPA: DNA-directed RNA polymerase subunit D [Methanoregulaceae archaeon]|nr:DNA-directed RNA polymerase subunit D [Methanoregulaceae archaeon]